MNNKFFCWLAYSPIATIAKVSLGAAIAYLSDNLSSYNLDPIVKVAITAAIPYIINWLNPADVRYGRIKL